MSFFFPYVSYGGLLVVLGYKCSRQLQFPPKGLYEVKLNVVLTKLSNITHTGFRSVAKGVSRERNPLVYGVAQCWNMIPQLVCN